MSILQKNVKFLKKERKNGEEEELSVFYIRAQKKLSNALEENLLESFLLEMPFSKQISLITK